MQVLNRFNLKLIALISMFIDHVGAIIGYDTFRQNDIEWLYFVFRIIGRISFPIFAFFVAEGWFYTRNRKKYFLNMLLFAIISQPIYYFALNINVFDFNILFTFCISILLFLLIDNMKKYKSLSFIYIMIFVLILTMVLILDILGLTISYGIYGVCLPLVFYLLYNSNIKQNRIFLWGIVSVLVVLKWFVLFIFNPQFNIQQIYPLLALFSIPLLMLYNGEKGNYSFKWLFYIFYPAHLFFIYITTLFI